MDYNDVRPLFKSIEMEQDEKKLSLAETKGGSPSPGEDKGSFSIYFEQFFGRLTVPIWGQRGFNAMFAVSSVDLAAVL